MSRYDINMKRLALAVLPPKLRTASVAGLCYSMTAPLNSMVARAVRCREDAEYRLTHNGQVCRLRAAANDKFDPTERRIEIEDAEGTSGVTIWRRDEDRHRMARKRDSGEALTVYRRGKSGGGADFVVKLNGVALDEDETRQLEALINAYKTAGMRYIITQ